MSAAHSPSDASISRLDQALEAVVARQPTRTAAVFGAERISYIELNERADRLARCLQEIGVGPDSLVGVYLERSIETLVGLLGVLKAGGAYIPLDVTYPPDRIALMLKDARPVAVVTMSTLCGGLADDVKTGCVDRLNDPATEAGEDSRFALRGTGDHLAYVIYTSGSTGVPKGVEIAHRSILSLFEATRPLFNFTPADVWTAFHSYGFDLSVWEIFGCLLTGGRLVIVPRQLSQSPADFWELLGNERVSVLSQTPSALRQLAYARRLRPAEPSSTEALRLIICGGESLSSDLALEVLKWGVPLWNFYGPTEASVWTSAARVEPESCRGSVVPIGRAFSNARVYVLDEELRPVAPGVSGEICIAGLGLARGYLNRPELTKTKFVTANVGGREERLYRTGDCGRYTISGELEFLGRFDEQVKIRGYRVELGEIEAALRQHYSVEDCAVLASGDSGAEKRLFAYVVYEEGRHSTAAELREFLRRTLPDYMIPAGFVAIEKLPLSASGKIDRKSLSLPRASAEEIRAPADLADVEGQLMEIWRRLLRVANVSVTQNFFELGGDSVLAVDLFCEIERVFGRYLPLVTLLENQTIADLAAVIRGHEPESVTNASLVPVRRAGTETPLFLIHPVGGTILGFKDLLRHLHPSRPLYGLQSRGLNDEGVPFRRVEEMAAYYLRQVRGVTPNGPYALVGLCFGAVVAYEMAQQITQAGEEIQLLCMLDPDPPDYDAVEPPLVRRVQAKWAQFRNQAPSARMPYLLTQAENVATKLRDMLLRTVSSNLPRPPGEVEIANFEAIRRYQPSPLRAGFTIVRALERPDIEYASQLEWRRCAAAGMAIEEVPGNHRSMMEEPHVRVLASKLEKYLQKTSVRATPVLVAVAALTG